MQAVGKRTILFLIFNDPSVTFVYMEFNAIAVPVGKFSKKKLSYHTDSSALYFNQAFHYNPWFHLIFFAPVS
jgi:hypothetical protein